MFQLGINLSPFGKNKMESVIWVLTSAAQGKVYLELEFFDFSLRFVFVERLCHDSSNLFLA